MEKDGVMSVKIKDQALRQYLLGELPQTERDQLEDIVFADRDLFEQLEVVEDELIESYVRNEMTKQERERFEEAYLTVPTRRKKVEHAESLLANLPAEPSSLSFVGQALLSRLAVAWQFLFKPRWQVQTAFATLLVAVISYSLWINREKSRLSEKMEALNTQRNTVLEEKRTLEQSVAQQQQRLEQAQEQLRNAQQQTMQLEEELNALKSASTSELQVELQLSARDLTRRPTRTRSDLSPKIVSKSAELVQIRLVPQDIAPNQSYGVVLTNDDDKTLWSQYRLETKTISGHNTLTLLIPAEVFLNEGDYILKLLASSEGKEFDVINTYMFRVSKR